MSLIYVDEFCKYVSYVTPAFSNPSQSVQSLFQEVRSPAIRISRVSSNIAVESRGSVYRIVDDLPANSPFSLAVCVGLDNWITISVIQIDGKTTCSRVGKKQQDLLINPIEP